MGIAVEVAKPQKGELIMSSRCRCTKRKGGDEGWNELAHSLIAAITSLVRLIAALL
jgi:hypothetical protein